MRRVVVTGIGATTPLAGDAMASWEALLQGKSGIATLEQDWVAKYELPVTFAGQAKIAASSVLSPQEAKRLDPSSQFALISAREAWADAGEPEVEPERLAVDFATGIGGGADPTGRLEHSSRARSKTRTAHDCSDAYAERTSGSYRHGARRQGWSENRS